MAEWKPYIFSIIAAAVCCGIISQILSDSKSNAIIHLICGTILAIFILQPLSEISPEDLPISLPVDNDTAEYWAYQGETKAKEARAEYIKATCETYILDRARQLGGEIQVQVFLDENLIPAFTEIEGTLPPSKQTQLQNILTEELGIPKENQTWIWSQENNSS